MSCCCVGCVDSSERGIVQYFGKFSYIASPGLSCIFWPFQTLIRVSTKVSQIDCHTATKTKDNVTVKITTAVQFSVDPSKV